VEEGEDPTRRFLMPASLFFLFLLFGHIKEREERPNRKERRKEYAGMKGK